MPNYQRKTPRKGCQVLTIAERVRLARLLFHNVTALRDGEPQKQLSWETIARAIAGEPLIDETLVRIRERLDLAEVEQGMQ